MSHKKDNGSLFPSHKYDYHLRIHNIKLLCNQINNDYELPNVHPHSSRHTYASLLFSANVSARQVQILLGHSEIETTLNIYTHVTNGDKNLAIEKLNNMMNPKKLK